MSIAEFLTARYNEEIDQVTGRMMRPGPPEDVAYDSDIDAVVMRADRFAADLAAKRAIVAGAQIAIYNTIERRSAVADAEGVARETLASAMYLTLRHLAAPYATHPDYDPRWTTPSET